MKRRAFITFLCGAAAWPFAAWAQQPDKTPRVGYLRSGASNNDPYRESFVRGMRDLGYVEGHNIAFEFRQYGDDVGSIPLLVSDLLRAKVDIIVAAGAPAVRAAQGSDTNDSYRHDCGRSIG
jgi:putative ABC transport system substrate-binding protein